MGLTHLDIVATIPSSSQNVQSPRSVVGAPPITTQVLDEGGAPGVSFCCDRAIVCAPANAGASQTSTMTRHSAVLIRQLTRGSM